jgi:predicted N-acyltransferase
MTKATPVTNAHYSQLPAFKKACQQYLDTTQQDIELDKVATRRQASKFRRGTGVVYKTISGLMQ